MKDLTHYFNSPPPSSKKSENESLVDEKTPKMNKKVRKKRLKLDKLTPPEAENDSSVSELLPNNDVEAEIVVPQTQELVNGDLSANVEAGTDTGCNNGSGRKKKRRKLSPSIEDTSKQTKRKVAKGRLKIINIPLSSPDSSNSPQPQLEKTNSVLAKDILVNSLVVEKLSSLICDDEEDDDDGYEIEDDSEKDEDYNCKKVKRKRKKRKSSRRTSVENGGNSGAVITPLRNKNESVESLDKLVEVEPVSEKRNSLFMYYSKVDKKVNNVERMSEKIKVQALVHTPPSEKRRSNSVITPSASVKKSLIKKFNRLQKEFMNASDDIEFVSSEDIVQSQTSEVKQNDTSCDSLNDSNSCGAGQLDVRTISDWKIKLKPSLSKSDSVSTEDMLANENEPPNSDVKNALDTPSKSKLSHKRTRKSKQKLTDTVDECENSSEATTKKVKSIKRQSKLKISPPYSVVDVDDSSNDSVCEARTVRESTTNRNCNTSAKISLGEKSAAGLMAKFLGKSLVCSAKESAPKIEKVDPSVLIARQKFLKSGLPDDFRQKIASQIEENILDPPPFPSVSHVQQRDPMRLIWNIPEPSLKLGPSPSVDLEVTSDWQTLFPEIENYSTPDQSISGEPLQKIRNKSFVKEFLRMKTNTQLAINDRWALMKSLKSAGVDSACWTDIYKPRTSHDILANKSCVERFKLWLETYKNTAVKQTGDEGSSDEFVHSSDESSSLSKERICIISGPIGCGKTSTVYAVAQELGYKVLEVNASHNRNGKKVTADLSEATQSHQVEHGGLKDIFNNGRKVKKKKTKNKAANDDVSSKKRSLILVEDADILFEGVDEGFIPAIAALSQTSKRPMVFSVNNIKAQHFLKFVKTSDLMLEFHRPSPTNLATWLQLIAMAEGIHLDDSHAERIAHWSNSDVRKSVVQLQFLAQSCESTAEWPSYVDRARWPSAVMNDDVITKDDVTADDDVTTSSRSKMETIASLRSLARRSDSLVISDLLATSCDFGSRDPELRDPCPRPEHCVCRDSTALNEATARTNSGDHQTNYFAEHIFKSVQSCVASDVRCPKKRWKSDNNLKTALPLLVRCSHSAIFSDYLPTLRFFGQCEDLRLSAYTRRNRSFNYLQGLGVNTSDGLAFDAFS